MKRFSEVSIYRVACWAICGAVAALLFTEGLRALGLAGGNEFDPGPVGAAVIGAIVTVALRRK